MNESFEKEFYLRTADFDCRMDLQPASILDLFQDVAGEHARVLGIGRDVMLENQLIWVIVKVRYRILSMPKQFDRVRVKTWPLPPRRSLFQREYKIMAEDGTPLVLGSSEWVVIHAERRRLMPVGDVYPLKDGFLEERNFEDGFTRLADFSGEGACRTIVPLFTELDMNGHVNNTKYANYVMDTVNPGEGEHISEFQIEYHREVQPEHPLSLLAVRGEGQIDIKGTAPDGARMFTARIVLA